MRGGENIPMELVFGGRKSMSRGSVFAEGHFWYVRGPSLDFQGLFLGENSIPHNLKESEVSASQNIQFSGLSTLRLCPTNYHQIISKFATNEFDLIRLVKTSTNRYKTSQTSVEGVFEEALPRCTTIITSKIAADVILM